MARPRLRVAIAGIWKANHDQNKYRKTIIRPPGPTGVRVQSSRWSYEVCSDCASARSPCRRHGVPAKRMRSAGLFGVFLVSKEYGTVRGTFLTSVRGRDITRLNYLFGEGVDPRLSPVDNRVLFTSTRGGTPGLWTMDRKGEQQRRVCDGDQGDWFPDGRRILFRRQGQIMERSLDTGQETVLSPAGWKSCSSPACSPDGRKILFVTHQDGKDTLFRTTLEKPEPKRLVEGEILWRASVVGAESELSTKAVSHLWMIDADGSNCRQLTTAGGIQCRPAWSPDGSAVAYCEGPGPKGPWQMAAVRVDGTKKLSIPLGDVRSVLCSDWGVENPGQKPQPKGMVVRPQPRVRLWEIDPSVAVARVPTGRRSAASGRDGSPFLRTTPRTNHHAAHWSSKTLRPARPAGRKDGGGAHSKSGDA